MQRDTDEIAINRIIGEWPNGICLSDTDVEFHFNGPILRAITNPIVSVGQLTLEYPHPDFLDTACSLIRVKVIDVRVEPQERIQLSFENGATLVIPTNAKSGSKTHSAEFEVPETSRLPPVFEAW